MIRTSKITIAIFGMAAFVSFMAGTSPILAQQAPKPGDAVFLFGKTRYFHALVQKQHCEAVDKAAFDADTARYEKVRQRLSALYGEKFFAAELPDNTSIPNGVCDPMTLAAYGRHIGEIEQLLDHPR